MRVAVGSMLSVIGLAACGGSSPMSANGGSNQTITMVDYSFSPAAKTIKAGTTVKWENTGTTSHTATSDAGVSPAFDSGSLTAPGTTMDPYGGTMKTSGGSYSMTFSAPGTYTYHCTFHGTSNNMKGTITVTP